MKEFKWIYATDNKPPMDTLVLTKVRGFGLMILKRKIEKKDDNSMLELFNRYFYFSKENTPYYWTPEDHSVIYSDELIEEWSYIPERENNLNQLIKI